MVDINTANKAELRALARACSVDVDGMNVQGMRAALLEHQATMVVVVEEPVATPVIGSIEPVDPQPHDVVGEEQVAPGVVPDSAPVPPPIPVATRLERNGLKQPGAGTICRQIWDYCQSQYDAGYMPKAKELRAWGAGKLDDTTMTIQFYRWRKFTGIGGRQ